MSVYKRGKTFVMDFILNGVRHTKSCGTLSKKEARYQEVLERQRVMSEATESKQDKISKLLLSQAIDQVYEERWKICKDSKGCFRRAARLAVHMRDPLLGSIDGSSVGRLIKELEKTNSTDATINRYLASLKTVLGHFRMDHRFISLRKERNGRIRTITKTEEITLLKLLRDRALSSARSNYSDCADLFECLLASGCRLSELLDITYQDIDFEANYIRIWVNKGDRPRSIPLTRAARAILLARQEDSPVRPFMLNKFQAERSWSYARKQMGLEKDAEFTIHCLRHSTASRLVCAGIDLYVVKEILGHSSIKITERYAHLRADTLVEAISKLE